MRSAISISLIFTLLLGQAVFATPHVHQGCSADEAARHAARPHFHVHGTADHGKHCHHHSQEQPAPEPLEHDSDAIYAVDVDLSHASGWMQALDLAISLMGPGGAVSSLDTVVDSGVSSQDDLSSIISPRPRCALYLQLLSIRC